MDKLLLFQRPAHGRKDYTCCGISCAKQSPDRNLGSWRSTSWRRPQAPNRATMTRSSWRFGLLQSGRVDSNGCAGHCSKARPEMAARLLPGDEMNGSTVDLLKTPIDLLSPGFFRGNVPFHETILWPIRAVRVERAISTPRVPPPPGHSGWGTAYGVSCAPRTGIMLAAVDFIQ